MVRRVPIEAQQVEVQINPMDSSAEMSVFGGLAESTGFHNPPVQTPQERFRNLLDAAFSYAGIAIFYGSCHLNPFTLILVLMRAFRSAEIEWRDLRLIRRRNLDGLTQRWAAGRWCGSTRVAGFKVPWVLWNSTYSLLIAAALYDTAFSIGIIALVVMLSIFNSDSASICTDATLVAWITDNSSVNWDSELNSSSSMLSSSMSTAISVADQRIVDTSQVHVWKCRTPSLWG